MLTQSMPALSRALDGALPQPIIRAVMQALGNCGQDAVQRGGVAVMPNTLRGLGPNGQQGWNPYNTPNINNNGAWIPYNPNGNVFVDMPSGGGYRSGDWYSTNYGAPQFQFFSPIRNELTSVYGGPTNFFGGDTVFDNITVNNITANTVTNVSEAANPPLKFVPGGGAPGDNGSNGSDGGVGPAGPAGANVLAGGVQGFIPAMPVRRKFVVDRVTGRPSRFDVVVGVEFDPDTCELLVDSVQLPPVITKINTRSHTLRYYGPDNGLG